VQPSQQQYYQQPPVQQQQLVQQQPYMQPVQQQQAQQIQQQPQYQQPLQQQPSAVLPGNMSVRGIVARITYEGEGGYQIARLKVTCQHTPTLSRPARSHCVT
jgi:hypothetical protein